jgi:hypothetical protein
MMPAVNYEPAGVMARIKKLDIGSLFKKKKKPYCIHSGIVEMRHLLLGDLTPRSLRDLWTNGSNRTPYSLPALASSRFSLAEEIKSKGYKFPCFMVLIDCKLGQKDISPQGVLLTI